MTKGSPERGNVPQADSICDITIERDSLNNRDFGNRLDSVDDISLVRERTTINGIKLNYELTYVIKMVLYHLRRGGISFEDLVKKVDKNYPKRGSSLVQDLVTIDFIDTSDPTKVSLKDS
jgi:hypothetical protein